MKIYAICPISQKKVNERVARLNAVFTVLLITGFSSLRRIYFLLPSSESTFSCERQTDRNTAFWPYLQKT